MPFALALPVALSAISSLVRFRGRLDTILALNETTTGLPFALPPIPTDDAPHVAPMLAFFATETGRNILLIRGLEADWRAVSPDPFAGNAQQALGRLLKAYYEACDLMPESLGPNADLNRARVAKGPSKEMRLAYFVVESDRLSRNPAVTRVLLATADTLLEFGAENAGLFLANPRTKSIVEALLTEFAVKRDWDDADGAQVFRLLLGSAAAAALACPGETAERPVARVLFAALADVQKDLGADFVAGLVSRDGFQSLVRHCLLHTAEVPALLPREPVLQQALAAMLRASADNLTGILDRPGAITGVLEAGIAAAAASAAPLVNAKVGGQPLLAVVLTAVLGEAEKAAGANAFFDGLADGRFFPALYRVCLQSVAANPEALGAQGKLKAHVARLIAACAGELAKGQGSALPGDVFNRLATQALDTLANEPEFVGRHGEFAAKIVAAALASASQAVADGFTGDDLTEIADTVVRTAAGNLNLARLDGDVAIVVSAFGATLGNEGLAALTTARGRKQLFFAGLETLAANPAVWGGFAERGLVEPLVSGVIRALSTNPGELLSGPALVPAFKAVAQAAALRGRTLIEAEITPVQLEQLVGAALAVAERAVGETIDGGTLPLYLRTVVLAFLAEPIELIQPELNQWLQARLPAAA